MQEKKLLQRPGLKRVSEAEGAFFIASMRVRTITAPLPRAGQGKVPAWLRFMQRLNRRRESAAGGRVALDRKRQSEACAPTEE